MAKPSKKLLRVQDNERVDRGDAEHMTRQTASWVASVVGTLFGQSAVVAGFDATDANATTLRVVRNSGSFIAALQGAANSLYGSGTIVDSVLQDDGGVTQVDSVLAGLPNGWYHVYVVVGVAGSDVAQRVFWDSVGATEYQAPIATRWILTWSVVVALHNAAAPVGSARVATVNWDGALDAAKIYAAKAMLFEGAAVPGGSVATVPAPVLFGGADHLVDFDRQNDRSVVGAQTFAQFANAVLKCVEEIKDPHGGRWWEKPPRGLSLRAASAYTVTVGQGTALSTGHYNAASVAGGYYNITAALQAIAADMLIGAIPQPVAIQLKPGLYEVSALVQFAANVEVYGAGPFATEIKFTGTGALQFGGASVAHVVADLGVTGVLASGALQYVTGVSLRLERVWGTAPVTLANLNAAASGVGDIVLHDCAFSGAVRCETGGASIRARGSVLGDIVAGFDATKKAPRIDLDGCSVGGVRVNSSAAGVSMVGCRVGTLKITGTLDADVTVAACRFDGVPSILGVAQTWRIYLDDLITTKPASVAVRGCEFVGRAGCSGLAAGGAAGAANLRAFLVEACRFAPDPAAPTAIGADQAVWVEDDPNAIAWVRACEVTDYAAGAFGYVQVDGVVVRKTIDAAMAGSVFYRCPVVRRATVVSSLATCTTLAWECVELADCDIQVPAITSAGNSWRIHTPSGWTTELRLLRCRFPGAITDWSALDGPVLVEACDFAAACTWTLRARNGQGLRCANTRIGGAWTVTTAGAYASVGTAVHLDAVAVAGATVLDGQWGAFDAEACQFMHGLRAYQQGADPLVGSARVRGCVCWPSGEIGGTPAAFKTTGAPFPSSGTSLTVARSVTNGSSWYDVEVRACALKGALDDALYAPGSGLRAVVWLDAGMHAILVDCVALLCCTADASVDDWQAIRLEGRGVQVARNQIIVDNVDGADRAIKRLFRLVQAVAVDGNARAASTVRLDVSDNQVDFAWASGGANNATVKTALIEYDFDGVDDGETVLLVVQRNAVHMTTFDAATKFAATVAAGPIAQAAATGVMAGNVVRDRAGNIAALGAATVAVQKAGPAEVFLFADNAVI